MTLGEFEQSLESLVPQGTEVDITAGSINMRGVAETLDIVEYYTEMEKEEYFGSSVV